MLTYKLNSVLEALLRVIVNLDQKGQLLFLLAHLNLGNGAESET